MQILTANCSSNVLILLQMIEEIFNGPFPLIGENQNISTSSFLTFLNSQRDHAFGGDVKTVSNFITELVQDPQRDVHEPYLTSFEVGLKVSLQKKKKCFSFEPYALGGDYY